MKDGNGNGWKNGGDLIGGAGDVSYVGKSPEGGKKNKSQGQASPYARELCYNNSNTLGPGDAGIAWAHHIYTHLHRILIGSLMLPHRASFQHD